MLIFPAIDLKDGKCVRLRQGLASEVTVYSDDPVAMAKHWESQGAEFLHVVDLDGAFTGESRNMDWVKRICVAIRCPVQLGGGMRDEPAIKQALEAGVRRVVVGTKALAPGFLQPMLRQYGESIVVGIDARDGKVAVEGWTQKSTQDAFEFARQVASMGAARIIFTDVQTDGMLTGPPLESIRKLCGLVTCRVIASGGVSQESDVHVLRALKLSNLEGVIVGKALYEKKVDLRAMMAV